MELCKEKVEVWKLEEFGDGTGAWRANRDGKAGVPVSKEELQGKGEDEGILGIEGIPRMGKEPKKVDDSKPAFAIPKDESGKLAPTGDKGRPRALFEKGHGPVKHSECKQ